MVQDDEEGGEIFKRMTSATHYIVPKAFFNINEAKSYFTVLIFS